MSNTVDWMLAQQACRDLVLRAAVCADAGDAPALSMLFTEDAVLIRPGAQPLKGRDAIFSAYAQRPTDRITRHLITNSLVEFDSSESAHARSYVLLWTGSKGDTEGSAGRLAQVRQMVGEFDDKFSRMSDGQWLIRQREARFVLYRDG